MANTTALAFENSFRIRQCRAIVEPKVHVFGIDGNVKNPVAQALAGAVANGDGAVCIIDVLVTRRHFFEHERPKLQCEIANVTFVRPQKLYEIAWRRMLHDMPLGSSNASTIF